MLYGILTATSALFLAAVLSALLRVPALRLGLVDRRRVRPVPLLGGVAVVGSTCLVAAAGGWTGAAPLSDGVGGLLAAGAGVAVLGLAADVWRLKTRFLLVGAAVAAAFVVPFDETGLPAGIAAVGWIACVAAAFRGLDHADGLAGTVGVLTAFGAGACAAAEMMDDLAVLLSVLAAALTGFLMHNWHPARLAFGACGSLFTGFVLAGAAVLVRTGYDAGSTAAVLFAFTAMASADTVLVVLSRRLAGRPVRRRGPDHLAHRLRRLGLTPSGTTVVLGAATFAAVLVGVLVHTDWLAPTAALWVAGVFLAAVLGMLCVRVYGPRRPTGFHGTGVRRDGATTTRRAAEAYGTATRSRAADAYGTATRSRAADAYGTATRSRAAEAYGTGTRASADVCGSRSRAEAGGSGGAHGYGHGLAFGGGDAFGSSRDAFGYGGRAEGPTPPRAPGAPRTPGAVPADGGVRPAGAARTPRDPTAPRTSHIVRTWRQYAPQIFPAVTGRPAEHPVRPPQQSTSPQVRESLRVRGG